MDRSRRRRSTPGHCGHFPSSRRTGVGSRSAPQPRAAVARSSPSCAKRFARAGPSHAALPAYPFSAGAKRADGRCGVAIRVDRRRSGLRPAGRRIAAAFGPCRPRVSRRRPGTADGRRRLAQPISRPAASWRPSIRTPWTSRRPNTGSNPRLPSMSPIIRSWPWRRAQGRPSPSCSIGKAGSRCRNTWHRGRSIRTRPTSIASGFPPTARACSSTGSRGPAIVVSAASS